MINYGQCWEDPNILRTALAIKKDDVVLSVTSGGDNTLALLLDRPREVVAIDHHAPQNHLLEVKLTALKNLDYRTLLEFIGVTGSSKRLELFLRIKKHLTPEAAAWWNSHENLIERGIIHSGRLESFLRFFRNAILPMVHSRRTVSAFLESATMEQQRDFYSRAWNTKRWRFLLGLFSGRTMLKQFARQQGMFAYVGGISVGEEYLRRFEKNVINVPLSQNYFMRYCLTGAYGASLPPYLEERNHMFFKKENTASLSIVTENLFAYLTSVPDAYFSKFNLSDVFEAFSERENHNLWQEIVRTSKPGATVVYWNNLVSRSFPRELAGRIVNQCAAADELFKKDRVFFYGSFHINTINQ